MIVLLLLLTSKSIHGFLSPGAMRKVNWQSIAANLMQRGLDEAKERIGDLEWNPITAGMYVIITLGAE